MPKFFEDINLENNKLLNVDLSNASLERLSSHPQTTNSRVYYNTTYNRYYGYIDSVGWFPLSNTQWQPSVATYSDLTNIDAEDGMVVMVRDSDLQYTYDGTSSSWVSIDKLISVLNVTTDTTLTLKNTTIFVDTSSNEVTITLPSASTSVGYLYKICKTGMPNKVIIDTNGGNINGNTTLDVVFKNSTACLESDGTNYHIV